MNKKRVLLLASACAFLMPMISSAQLTVNGSNTEGYYLNSNTAHSNGASINLHANGNTWGGGTGQGSISMIAGEGSTNTSLTTPALSLSRYGNNTYPTLFTVLKNGKFGINTSSPSEMLSVNGNIGANGNILFDQWSQLGAARSINAQAPKGSLLLRSNNDWQNGASIMLNSSPDPVNTGNGTSVDPGAVIMASTGAGGTGVAHAFVTWDHSINTWRQRMIINRDGLVSIGQNGGSTSEKLTVFGGIGATGNIGLAGEVQFGSSSTQNLARIIKGQASNGSLLLRSNTDWGNGASIMLNSATSTDPGAVIYSSNGIGGLGAAHAFVTWDNGINTWKQRMIINRDGQVIMGDGAYAPNNLYTLFVGKGILTEKIKVATITGGNWSDFVFADDYKLRDLDEVESFIKENKHLPEIPSAKEVEKDGLDLAQMDAKLLQKVEELTLYMIEMKKQSELQRKEISELKKQLKAARN